MFRVHKFLEEWGLINHQVDDGTIPEFEAPILDYTHVDTPFGVKLALKEHFDGERVQKLKKKQREKKDAFGLRENLFLIADKNQSEEVLAANGCSFCGIDCTQSRYRCKIECDMILCAKCFDTKRYSMLFNVSDFEMELEPIKKCAANVTASASNFDEFEDEETARMDLKNWDDAEIKNLKNALKEYHDDWAKVSDAVGRNQQECIAQFLQLPIADSFIDDVEHKRDNDLSKVSHPQISHFIASSLSNDANMEQMLSFLSPSPMQKVSPFADAAHPILAQSASLSAVVDSELVSVASNAALKFVSNQKVFDAKDLKIGRYVTSKMGRGRIESIQHNGEYVVKFEWGTAKLRMDQIFGVECNQKEENDEERKNVSEWQKYPQNVRDYKVKAAGILGGAAVIGKALKNHSDATIDQLMQHLVLLQSQKVKAKTAHLDELWNVLQREREEVEAMKEELFRERILIAKERLMMQQEGEDMDVDKK